MCDSEQTEGLIKTISELFYYNITTANISVEYRGVTERTDFISSKKEKSQKGAS